MNYHILDNMKKIKFGYLDMPTGHLPDKAFESKILDYMKYCFPKGKNHINQKHTNHHDVQNSHQSTDHYPHLDILHHRTYHHLHQDNSTTHNLCSLSKNQGFDQQVENIINLVML